MLEKILEQYGVDEVSERTRISKKHLSKLMKKDFEGFSKPQAYGFVSILQREYGDDFSELKMELEAWFSGIKKDEEKRNEIFITTDAQRVRTRYGKWIAAILFTIFLLASFYFFTKEDLDGKEASKKVESIRHMEQKSEVIQKSEVPAAETKRAEPAEETKNKEVTAPLKSETKPYVPVENAVVTPNVKLWFGIIDLKSKKRVAKTTAEPYEIESTGKKLLITGHGLFEISDSFGNVLKYNDSKKHYFLIDDGMVKEISISEFRRLNGGKVW